MTLLCRVNRKVMHDKIIHDFVRLTLSVRLNGPLGLKIYAIEKRCHFVRLSCGIASNETYILIVKSECENG